MARGSNRRDFMKLTAAASAGYFAAAGVAPKVSRAANETINFASIGVDGKGASDSNDAGRSGNMVAICDIDDLRLNKAGGRFPEAKKYNDYRKMFDEMGKSIDAVTVSTPDHTHAVASAMAMHMGKACFTQKPLTHSIWEARRLGEIATETGVATQMGNQGTANSGLRHAGALIQNGTLGTISEVHVWTNRPVWPQGLDRPSETPDVPATIHWEEWIGPAPFRPYHPAYHPFKWRGWWDFGTGALGDMACHTLNMPFFGADLKYPTSVVAETSGHNKETYPKWSVITFEFPATDKRGPVKLFWYDGGKVPPDALRAGAKLNPNASSGALVIGDKGTLHSPGDYCAEFEIIGMDKVPDAEFEKSPGHFEEWVRAIKGGPAAMSNFPNYAAPLTETILLGNLAVWADGKKVEWDAKNLKCTSSDEFDHIIHPPFRDGYTLDHTKKA
ncbi:MAG: Gfo/Idh/MocA family oxidoreductase [Planctomycetales bacterium]|nr:Gfo/Idh/MocA family oxidoreductase [Planctomycetales bacterium]MCA9218846.1 Gfo/Idh/MocA family oxidoreductase [Planctomycetales bacterium]